MAKPASTGKLTLAEAVALLADRLQMEPDEAQKWLLALLRRGQIVACGALPLNAHPDAEWAWQHAHASTDKDIPASTWSFPVDWARGRVNRYREVAIPQMKLMALFRTARGPGRRPPPTKVREVVRRYVDQERAAQKPVSKLGCWKYVREHLPGATRDQAHAELAEFEPAKPRGRPHKGA